MPTMLRKTGVLIIVFGTTIFSITLSGQMLRPWYLAPPDFRATGEVFAIFLKTLAEWGIQRDNINNDLTRARGAFWREYPNGPNLEKARRDFSSALTARDRANQEILSRRMLIGSAPVSPALGLALAERDKAMVAFMDALSGTGNTFGASIEPTPPFAEDAFGDWVYALVLGAKSGLSREEIYAKALPQYLIYVDRRDRAEFLFNSPRSPLKSNDPDEITKGMFLACRPYSSEEAIASVQTLKQLVPQEAWASAQKSVQQSWSKSETMTQTNNFYEGCWGPRGMVDQLRGASPRVYAITMLYGKPPGIEIASAATTLAAWDKQVGPGKVDAAAARIQNARNLRSNNSTASASAADVTDKCLNLGNLGCLTTLLGVAPPKRTELEVAQRALDAATANRVEARAAAIARIPASAEGTPEQRFREVTSWIDEKLILGAYSNPKGTPSVDFWNISILPSAGHALLAGMLIENRMRQTRAWDRDLVGALESVRAEYDRMVVDHGAAKVLAALNATRFRLSPSLSGTYFSGDRGETPYSVFLKNLD
jgi:hypothetical protein